MKLPTQIILIEDGAINEFLADIIEMGLDLRKEQNNLNNYLAAQKIRDRYQKHIEYIITKVKK